MRPEKRRQIYEAAIDKFGDSAQLNMFYEEFGELLQAINKFNRTNNDGLLMAVHEEIVDCFIMLEQLALIFNLDPAKFEEILESKLRRLRNRIEG